ncbi:MarR family transcriptional regulator [Halobacteriales archaeon QS_4_69_31]|jgi:ArsR family transcriptional regulator|nr:MAG: MarR family transcriptional regulator [Halobacteriales archaeon QS_4_69_31]
MDSAALLDLLGNANRRRILRLLAHKPCYVTEISEYLSVSPKAVIDHLDKLEEAGLVESRVDDQRRKYFHIARNLRLEVTVSPYQFGTKSAYPASQVDVTACRYLSIETEFDHGADAGQLARELNELRDLETELSMAQRWVHGRLTEVMEALTEKFDGEDSRLFSDVLSTLAAEPGTVEEVSRQVEAPPEVVAGTLRTLAEEDVVVEDGDEWRLPE